ncbi:histidine phosphatase family protein [Brevibacillus daliensis]|uniref:histidine phosphatase family protein n=1 Tax=Brevibacillus daliensis TaxID=2892995 RepID=UPI001E4C155D|nr:histidine phosphatase family protein [Brevibacillus daliensis]
MKNIYIVRHCKATGQEAEAKLTESGIEQAEKLADFLHHKNIDSVISSPFERAYRTIEPFATRSGIDILTDDRLQERVLIGESHPDWLAMLQKTFEDRDLCYQGGESSNVAMNRAASVLQEVLHSESQNVVLVSHGNLITLLLSHVDETYGFNEWQTMSNPDVYIISYEDNGASVQRLWIG